MTSNVRNRQLCAGLRMHRHNGRTKAFDHDAPANRDGWVFAFVGRYCELRPEIGEKYAKTHALIAGKKLAELTPKKVAEKWFKDPQ